MKINYYNVSVVRNDGAVLISNNVQSESKAEIFEKYSVSSHFAKSDEIISITVIKQERRI